MSERIFKIPAGHPGCERICYRCGNAIGAHVDCFLDSEAPATAIDAVRMTKGLAYVSMTRLRHASCYPVRKSSALLNVAESKKNAA